MEKPNSNEKTLELKQYIRKLHELRENMEKCHAIAEETGDRQYKEAYITATWFYTAHIIDNLDYLKLNEMDQVNFANMIQFFTSCVMSYVDTYCKDLLEDF